MKLVDIQPGKKYYSKISLEQRKPGTNERLKEVHVTYVLEVDRINKKACASINKAPAKWYTKDNYKRWQVERPQI